MDTSLHLPDLFTIRLSDPGFKWMDDTLLDIGKEVEISMKAPEQYHDKTAQATILIKGEITALEPHFSSDDMPTMTVRGYDKAHRLHRGKKTRTFLKQNRQRPGPARSPGRRD